MKSKDDLIERSQVYKYLPEKLRHNILIDSEHDIDIWNKAIDEVCLAIKRVPKADINTEALNRTWFNVNFSGSAITYAQCIRCKRHFTYPTDDPFNCCPYCMARRED